MNVVADGTKKRRNFPAFGDFLLFFVIWEGDGVFI